MNDVGKILIGVLIGLILIGLAITFAPHDAYENSTDNITIVDQAQSNDNVGSLSIVKNSQSNSSAVKSNSTGSQLSSSSSSSSSSSDSGVSGGSAEYNGQAGGGYYYQINYKDGNFRQYDTKTGELIGSSFSEDQEKLGNFNGEML